MAARTPWSVLAAAVTLLACGSPLPTPRTGPHLGEVPVTIPYPPPPGRVEIIPARPPALKHPVWVDGEWDWGGRRWQWKDGVWADQAPDTYYALPLTLRASDGTLEFFPGGWKKKASVDGAATGPTPLPSASPPAVPPPSSAAPPSSSVAPPAAAVVPPPPP